MAKHKGHLVLFDVLCLLDKGDKGVLQNTVAISNTQR